jgi:uncharacterized protein YrrD
VVSEGNEVGKVRHVVVSPRTGEAMGLVIRTGTLLGHDVVVPIDAVRESTEEGVFLSLRPSELNVMPEYHEEQFVEPPDEWHSPGGLGRSGFLFRRPRLRVTKGLSPAEFGRTEDALGGRPIRHGQKVVCSDGHVGRVDLVLLDPRSRRVAYLVVRKGRWLGRDTIVPIEFVRDITRDQVVVDLTRAQLEGLPDYRPDWEITSDVIDALWYRSGLRPVDLYFVEVRTEDGIVELNGHTLTREAIHTIERIARSIRGVLDVRNNLRVFDAVPKPLDRSRRGRRGATGAGA